jgi:hypothetical protein
MLRISSMALLMLLATPVPAADSADTTVVTQERQPSQQVPKRDCEKRGEGVSV